MQHRRGAGEVRGQNHLDEKLLEGGAHRLGRGHNGGGSDSIGFGGALAVGRGLEARVLGVLSTCSLRGKRGARRKLWAGSDCRLLMLGGMAAAGPWREQAGDTCAWGQR
jgi:hypothetical protein